MNDQVRVTVSVRVPPAVAFEVFTKEIDVWWKRGPQFRRFGTNAGTIHFECTLGGRLLETLDGESGAQLVEVGRVTTWDPPHRFIFEWSARNFEPRETTEVEVTFDAAPSGTTVHAVHRGFSKLRPDHPVRHGLDDARFLRTMGMWWGELMTSLRSTCEAAYAAVSMDRDFWLARWREGRIAFHESTPNVFLTTYAALLGPPPRRIFVPLCGKARDLAYLASLGHEVIGVELSSIAAEAFFTESAVTPESAQRGPFASLTAGSVTILVGDVFDADATTLGHIDAVYDRAAIVALEPAVQERYARHIVSLLPPDGPILLVTFDYDTSKMKGPPFAVPPDRVQELFGARCNIEKLDSRDVGEERPSFRAAGAIETAFHLTVRA